MYEGMRQFAAGLPKDDNGLDAVGSRGWVLSHRDWIWADRVRAGIAERWRVLFREFDVVICPIMPTPAFPHDHGPPRARKIDIDGTPHAYLHQTMWPGVATLTGQPATAVPLGRADNGLPVGAQIVGPYLEDRTTLRFAALIEREFGGFVAPPGYAG
jgi:amidase